MLAFVSLRVTTGEPLITFSPSLSIMVIISPDDVYFASLNSTLNSPAISALRSFSPALAPLPEPSSKPNFNVVPFTFLKP